MGNPQTHLLVRYRVKEHIQKMIHEKYDRRVTIAGSVLDEIESEIRERIVAEVERHPRNRARFVWTRPYAEITGRNVV